ncbi:MAG: hypothetical protein SOT34_01640 [Candidatus Borkfalkiaceae bacterium]|nr:hypothetical protein [Christensenellaceae bacterium]
MDKLEFLVVIIDVEKTAKLLQRLSDCGVNFIHVLNARGTANSEILDLFAVGETDKNVILSTASSSVVEEIKKILTTDFAILKKGNGIAFTIPVASVGGPATLRILSGMDITGGAK